MTAITRVRRSHAIERRLAMSQQNIEDVVRWLMTDEDLRVRTTNLYDDQIARQQEQLRRYL